MPSDPLTEPILNAALRLWDYHRIGHEVVPAEGILVFGSSDLRVAAHAADLFHAGLGPWILFSGGRGRMTEQWAQTEAEAMAAIARKKGVPEEAILMEPCATNTGENIRFSREVLAARGIALSNAVVVQKPYMERRTLAALDLQWPELAVQLSSPPLGFHEYCSTDELPAALVIAVMVGDFQRILDYPAKGFASVQPVPPEVMEAYEVLVAAGYTAHLRVTSKRSAPIPPTGACSST